MIATIVLLFLLLLVVVTIYFFYRPIKVKPDEKYFPVNTIMQKIRLDGGCRNTSIDKDIFPLLASTLRSSRTLFSTCMIPTSTPRSRYKHLAIKPHQILLIIFIMLTFYYLWVLNYKRDVVVKRPVCIGIPLCADKCPRMSIAM